MSTERNKRKRLKQKAKRRERLAHAEKRGWKQCSEYHFQKIVGGKLVNWWPSTSKIMVDSQVYKIIDVRDVSAIIKTLVKSMLIRLTPTGTSASIIG